MGSRILADRYELLDKIGEGGMAVVFRAKDKLLNRFVAIKILRPEYIKDESFIESFRRESQLVAGIVDKNIVTVYDVGQQGNIHYIVMELVEGETLSEIIKREGKLEPRRCASYAKQIAMALATAHKNKLIHRDIKPHNIMVTRDGVAKLMDFGIAKKLSNNTMVGDEKEAVMGSIHYFSPEQARGLHIDERSDIYSLGIVMYEMITGKVPYDGENAVEVAVKHMNEEMVRPSKLVRNVPQDYEDIILKATSKNPDQRYASAEDMIIALSFIKFSRIADPDKQIEVPDIDLVPDGTLISFDDEDEEERTESINGLKDNLGGILRKENKKEKIEKPRAVFNFAIVLAVVLAIGLAIPVSSIIANSLTEEKDDGIVQVPHLEDMSYEEATKTLEDLGLGITIESEIVNDAKEIGTILSYSPSEGTNIKKGQSIKVNISKKSSAKTVPNLYMQQLSSAKTKISQNGFTLGTVTEANDSDVPKGYIISSNPGAGTELEKGGKINLVVSLGPEVDDSVFTLNLYNMTMEDAINAVSSAGCTYKIVKGGNTSVEEGHVYMQDPTASTEIKKDEAADTLFTIYVSNASGEQSTETEKTVSLTLDMSYATSDIFYVSVNLQFDNGVTKSPYLRYAVTNTGEGIFYLDVSGNGHAKAYVSYDNTMIYTFDINFDSYSVSCEKINAPEEESQNQTEETQAQEE